MIGTRIVHLLCRRLNCEGIWERSRGAPSEVGHSGVDGPPLQVSEGGTGTGVVLGYGGGSVHTIDCDSGCDAGSCCGVNGATTNSILKIKMVPL